MKARNRLNVDDRDEAGFSKCSTANFEISCQNASASMALTQLLRLPLELYSRKSLLMCFLYLLKIFSYANIGGGRRLLGYCKRDRHSEKFGNHCYRRLLELEWENRPSHVVAKESALITKIHIDC